MNNRVKTAIERAVTERFPIDEDTQRLIRLANWDLHWGPIYTPDDGGPWPGFSGACEAIRDALDVHTVYVDTNSEHASDTLDEGYECEETGEWVEPYLDETYEVEASDVLAILVGKELASYVR